MKRVEKQKLNLKVDLWILVINIKNPALLGQLITSIKKQQEVIVEILKYRFGCKISLDYLIYKIDVSQQSAVQISK